MVEQYRGLVLLPFRTITGLWRADRDIPAGVHIVRDADEWTRLSAPSAHRHTPELPVPAVNWQTEMCVVAALGRRLTGGYLAMIDVIEVVGDHIQVLVWEIRPGPNCGTSRAITHPCHAVAVPAHPGEARLIKRVAYEDCEVAER
jgi:hypothetical protein